VKVPPASHGLSGRNPPDASVVHDRWLYILQSPNSQAIASSGLKPLPKIQDFYNRKGLISNHGEKKQAYFVLQSFYRELMKK